MTARLLQDLAAHKPEDEREEADRVRIVDLIKSKKDAFHRTCFEPGHVTGSALLVSADGSRVLMNHHKSLNKWLSFGGHADGETDILSVSRREIIEESGLVAIEAVSERIFDVDVHPIPANDKKREPAHSHFDIRYIFRAINDDPYIVSDESHEVRWCGFNEAVSLVPDASMKRLLGKWQKRLKS